MVIVDNRVVLKKTASRDGGTRWHPYGYEHRITVYCFRHDKRFDPLRLFTDKMECLGYCLRFRRLTVQAMDIVRANVPILDMLITSETEDTYDGPKAPLF